MSDTSLSHVMITICCHKSPETLSHGCYCDLWQLCGCVTGELVIPSCDCDTWHPGFRHVKVSLDVTVTSLLQNSDGVPGEWMTPGCDNDTYIQCRWMLLLSWKPGDRHVTVSLGSKFTQLCLWQITSRWQTLDWDTWRPCYRKLSVPEE